MVVVESRIELVGKCVAVREITRIQTLGRNLGIQAGRDGYNNANNIFIIGGNENESPKIAKLNGSGNNYTFSKLVTVTNSALGTGAKIETEGIQLKGDYIYFGIYNKYTTGQQRWRIYRIPKSVF